MKRNCNPQGLILNPRQWLLAILRQRNGGGKEIKTMSILRYAALPDNAWQHFNSRMQHVKEVRIISSCDQPQQLNLASAEKKSVCVSAKLCKGWPMGMWIPSLPCTGRHREHHFARCQGIMWRLGLTIHSPGKSFCSSFLCPCGFYKLSRRLETRGILSLEGLNVPVDQNWLWVKTPSEPSWTPKRPFNKTTTIGG